MSEPPTATPAPGEIPREEIAIAKPEPSAANPAPSRTPSAWRRCVLLCLPALVLGAILRLSFLTAIPEAYYGLDSNSYYDTTSALWLKHKWDLGPKRRWVYPLLLIPTPMLPGRSIVDIAVIQHTIGLLVTVLGIGWIVQHLTRRPAIWVPCVTIVAALWPRMVYYEHEVVAESVLVASIILAAALAFPVQRLREPWRLFWFLSAAALVIAVKPHGRPIWFGLMIAAILLAGAPWRWAKICWLPIAASVAIILTTGSSRQAPWLMLSSAFPLVNTEQGKWPEYRQILRPYIEEARTDLSQYAWRQERYKQMLVEPRETSILGPVWVELIEDKDKFSQVAHDLAIDAIVHSPVTYARLVLQKIGMVLCDEAAGRRMTPGIFWRDQLLNTEGRWERHPDEMKMLYGMEHDAYRASVDERRHRHPWYQPYVSAFSGTFAWMHTERVEKRRTVHPAWFGVLALFGFLTCLRPTRWKETAPLWLPLGLYLVIIFGIGDAVNRYLQPMEWIGIIFVALGLDWVIQLVRPVASPPPPSTIQ